MNKPYRPEKPSFTFYWNDLRTALKMMCNPDKEATVDKILDAVMTMSQKAGPERAIYTLISVIAWLTSEDGAGSNGDWMASMPPEELDL